MHLYFNFMLRVAEAFDIDVKKHKFCIKIHQNVYKTQNIMGEDPQTLRFIFVPQAWSRVKK